MGIFDIFRRQTVNPVTAAGAETDGTGLAGRLAAMPRWMLMILGAFFAAILYWGVIGSLLSDTRADLTVRPGTTVLPPGGSVAVATAAMLLDQALDKGWTPNDSLLRPTGLLEDMPAFQRGQHSAISAFVTSFDQGVGGDPELSEAADALKTPPDRGWLHGDFPFIGGSAESRYRDAIEALARYNRAVAESAAPGEGDARELRLALLGLSAALAEEAGAVDRMIDESRVGSADAQFNEVRGAAYAAAMLMRGLREDFGTTIGQRQLAATWAETTEALDAVAGKRPAFGVGRQDLVEQGYFLMRARESLRTLAAGLAR
ncbi:MAG: hypothetical protein H3C60_09205 [Sphingomonadaceae bacterium]|nr:hypothetical protein [Sphingomonadaceae bacterium]